MTGLLRSKSIGFARVPPESRKLVREIGKLADCQGRADNRPPGRRESVPLESQVISNNVRSE